MPIERIGSSLIKLPPHWLSQISARSGNIGNSSEIRKILGEPIPRVLDLKTLPPEIAAYFAKNGLLERLRKKLALISRKRGGKILPASNTIAAVDEDDNLYVGVEFLEQFGEDEALIAGILAHEWGHMLSDRPKGMNWSRFTWEELFDFRRTEEADADGFAGRALFLMGYKPDSAIEFLKKVDAKRKRLKLPHVKYHNTATRTAIFKAAWEAERRAMDFAKRLFFSKGKTSSVKIGRVIGEG